MVFSLTPEQAYEQAMEVLSSRKKTKLDPIIADIDKKILATVADGGVSLEYHIASDLSSEVLDDVVVLLHSNGYKHTLGSKRVDTRQGTSYQEYEEVRYIIISWFKV